MFSSSLNKFTDSSGVRTKYFSFAMYSKCTVCLARRRTGVMSVYRHHILNDSSLNNCHNKLLENDTVRVYVLFNASE